jgi:hypothetical protein
MGRPGHDGHLPFETLDRMLLSALSPAEKQGAESHIESCERCRAAFQTLRADCDHFDRDIFPRTLGKVRQRLEQPANRFDLSWLNLKQLWPAAGLAAAAAAVLLVVPRTLSHPEDDYDIGVKGGPAIQVYGLHAGAVRNLATGSRVAVGDRLRFVVDSSGYEYLLIASVDGAGNVSAFFPSSGSSSASIPRGRSEAPGSVELDAARGPEVLMGYFSHQPLELEKIAPQLKANADHPPRIEGASLPVVIRLEKDVP